MASKGNTSTKYLKLAKERRREEADRINLEIEISHRQIQYHILQKIGEANELAQKMKLTTNYRAYRHAIASTEPLTADQELSIYVYEGYDLKKEMSKNILSGVRSTRVKSAVPKVNRQDRQEELQQALLSAVHLTNKLKEQLLFFDVNAPAYSPFLVE